MAIKRESDVSLSSLSTFRLGGTAREVVTVETEDDLKVLFSSMPADRRWFLLGGGSNIVFPDGDCSALIIRLGIRGINIVSIEDEDVVYLCVGGAEPWDNVVSFAVDQGLSGIEALSWIPGTAGATPVQNVGAYGCEIKNVLVSLRAFDTATNECIEFSNEDCRFGYRDSIFKHEGKGRYIITQITLALSHDRPDVPQYPGVAEYLAEHGIRAATLADIRNAIIAIRTKKLPDPSEVASVGSFFKNSFIPTEQARTLKEKYPSLAVFPVSETVAKVGTGSLIDALGWKGKRFGNLSLYHGNAMVVVNEGGATRRELSEFIEMVKAEVLKTFGVHIEPEPELLDF